MVLRQAHATRLLAALLATIALLGSNLAVGQTIPIDDFNDCNDDAWTHVGHRTGNTPPLQDTPGGTWDANYIQLGSCAYRLTTVEANLSVMAASWDPSADTTFSDGFFRARVRAETEESAIIMAMRGDGQPFGDGYLGEIFLHNGTMRIRDHEVGPSSIVQTDLEMNANEDWFMQIGTVGNQFSLKAWPVGDTEPSSPQLSTTYSSRTSGLFVIGTGDASGAPAGTGSVVFDDLVFIVPEPSTAVLAAIGLLGILSLGRRR